MKVLFKNHQTPHRLQLMLVLAMLSFSACRTSHSDSNVNEATVTEKFQPVSAFLKAPDGEIVHYYTAGKGTPVLLLHGAGLDASIAWIPNGIAQKLAKKFLVIGIDQRGHGLTSGHIEQPLAIYLDPLMVLDHLGIKKAHFHGYSFGGQTTAGIVKMAPERVLSAAFGGFGITESREPFLSAVPLEPEPNDGYNQIEADATLEIRDLNETHMKEVEVLKRSIPRRISSGPTVTINESLFGDEIDLTAITFPVLSLIGEFDGSISNTHRMDREIKDYRKVIFPDRGHISLVTPKHIPQQYTEELIAFFERTEHTGNR